MSNTEGKKESRKRILTLEIEGGGRTFDFSSQKLELIAKDEPAIKLHFLRFGLFDRNGSDSNTENVKAPKNKYEEEENKAILLQEKEWKSVNVNGEVVIAENQKNDPGIPIDEVEVIAVNGMPKIENFYTARTILNAGYVYIMNADDSNDYYELEVDEDGTFQHIDWGYNIGEDGKHLDFRKASGERSTYKEMDPSIKSVWVAYSRVQWSRDYHTLLNTNVQKRKERMLLVTTTGIKKGQTVKNALPYHEVKAVYKSKPNSVPPLETTLKNIHEQEEKEDLEKKENLIFEDQFITLHDPVGCAMDIDNVVTAKAMRHKAFIEALHSGETHAQAITRLKNKIFEAPAPKPDYNALFSLALTTYKMVYDGNNAKTIGMYDGKEYGNNYLEVHPEDTTINRRITKAGTVSTSENVKFAIGKGLDHKKLINILGVEQRKSLRTIVFEYREDLGNYLKSDYTKLTLENYLHNIEERTVGGRAIILELLDNLFMNPYYYERTLLLSQHYKGEDDAWTQWVYDLLDQENKDSSSSITSKAPGFEKLDPLHALVAASISLNMNEVKDQSSKLSHKLAKVLRSNLKYLSKQVFNAKEYKGAFYKAIEKRQIILLSMLNKNLSLKIDGQKVDLFGTRKGDVYLQLDKIGVVLDPDYNRSNLYSGKKEDVLYMLQKDVEVISSKHGNHNLGLKVAEPIDENTFKRNLRNTKAAKILNGKAFNGVFAILEIINLLNAFTAANDDPSVKTSLKTLESAVKLTEAILLVQKAFVNDAKSYKAILAGQRSSYFGAVGAVFTSAMCFWDASDAFAKKDQDSGAAFFGAGIAFGVSAGVAITTVAAASGTAIGAGIAGVGTALMLTGPVGWVAALVGCGLLLAAQLYKDTDLETYYKTFLLSDHANIYPNGETPMQYTNRLLLDETAIKLVDPKATDALYLKNSYYASALLMDLLVCTNAQFKVEDNLPLETSVPRNPMDDSIRYKLTATAFSATMTYYKFFNNINQVEYKVYYLHYGILSSKLSPEELALKRSVYLAKDEKKNDAIQIKFQVPEEFHKGIHRGSQLLFVTRLSIDEGSNNYFPHKLDKGDRWLGALVQLQENNNSKGIMNQNITFKTGTMAELKEPKTWN
ncbi:hypothetical protein M601_001540 [Cellulophaga baltica 4]|nr:hypothetical protein M601_001540 [Cellulophaga baltica 4]